MNVIITDILNQWSLIDQSFNNLLTIELPSGARFQVSVDEAVLKAVLAEASSQMPQQAQISRVQEKQADQVVQTDHSNGLEIDPFEEGPRETPADWPERQQVEHHVETGTVEWETLPDTQLPPSIKRILKASQVSPRLTIQELDHLKLEISKKLASRPKAGQVDWDSGPKRRVESTTRRHISMDEAGNPRPPGGIIEMRSEDDRDPGEVRSDDSDDEGVPQA